ncbi:hypothetical protein GUJ93_ZPchr0010g9862 [Zizania palustris]|uniref:PHD finger protein ALFIN-LIKE n=1 Tax=Zizania palustris TaxID=103762 RepID=A0A8J5WA11_ZIZPA|nr:hypothetical protein GUJ93_ZPchr0010g9862 [Zizania palustris]
MSTKDKQLSAPQSSLSIPTKDVVHTAKDKTPTSKLVPLAIEVEVKDTMPMITSSIDVDKIIIPTSEQKDCATGKESGTNTSGTVSVPSKTRGHKRPAARSTKTVAKKLFADATSHLEDKSMHLLNYVAGAEIVGETMMQPVFCATYPLWALLSKSRLPAQPSSGVKLELAKPKICDGLESNNRLETTMSRLEERYQEAENGLSFFFNNKLELAYKRCDVAHVENNVIEADEGYDEDNGDHSETLCGTCGGIYSAHEFWIGWHHGKCVKITPAKAESIKQYKCPSCSFKRARL